MVLRLFGLVLLLSVVSTQSFGSLRQATDTLYDSADVKPCSAGISVCIGCKTYRICTGAASDEDNPQEMCSSDKPFCHIQTGECVSDPDNSLAQCGVAPSSSPMPPVSPNPTPTQIIPAFKCTGVGRFPDPYDCAKYFYCVSAGIDGDSYDCPPNQSYNVTSQRCQLDSGCKPIDCSDSEFVFNEYPTDPQYFYYCKLEEGAMPNTLPTVYTFSCGKGAKFDVCTEQCVFRCSREGLFAKPSDPNKYYQCYMDGGALKYVERTCPVQSQVFDEKVQFCIYQSVTVRRI